MGDEQVGEPFWRGIRWALNNSELYELLFGTPVPGYTAPHAATGPAATRGLLPLVDLVDRLRPLPNRIRPGGRIAQPRFRSVPTGPSC